MIVNILLLLSCLIFMKQQQILTTINSDMVINKKASKI